MKAAKLAISLIVVVGTGLTVYGTTQFVADQPSSIITVKNRRFAIPATAQRSIYKSEAECKNAIPQDLWTECESARSYYGDDFSLVDAWLGPLFVGDVDPNLSRTAQNLPISTVVADNRNVGQASLSKLVYELKSDNSTTKLLAQNLTSRFVRAQMVERQTKTQPLRRVVF